MLRVYYEDKPWQTWGSSTRHETESPAPFYGLSARPIFFYPLDPSQPSTWPFDLLPLLSPGAQPLQDDARYRQQQLRNCLVFSRRISHRVTSAAAAARRFSLAQRRPGVVIASAPDPLGRGSSRCDNAVIEFAPINSNSILPRLDSAAIMAWELTRRRFVRAVNSKFIYGRLVRARARRSSKTSFLFLFCTAD